MEAVLMLLRAGRVVSERGAALQQFNYQFLSCILESLLVLTRRCMIMSVGDPSLTMVAIVFTAFEEVLLRATLVERDLWLRRIRRLPALSRREIKTVRIVELAAINNSMVIESSVSRGLFKSPR